jgi:cation diffusion facilitator family transporter
MSDPESTPVVVAALLANVAIGGLKAGAFLLTGSAAMLAETYHSISDTGNQVLLLVGISRSRKDPTRTHPFGYGKAQFFYGFLVSVLLFGVAGWRSVSEGYHALTHLDAASGTIPAALGGIVPGVAVNCAVLVGVLACEGYSWQKAHHEVARQIDAHGWDGFTDAVRRTSDVPTLAAFIEDSIAVAGAGVALAGVALSHVTGNPVFDATAALLIGVLLMSGAVALAWATKRLLLGKSLPTDEERRLYAEVAEREAVADVPEFRTVFFGPERVVVTARVVFSDDLAAGELSERVATMKADLRAAGLGVETVYLTPDTPDTPDGDASRDTITAARPVAADGAAPENRRESGQ